MRILKTIASKQKTVIMTIHQPSSSIFEQFDRVMLLAPRGHLVFQGSAQVLCTQLQTNANYRS